MYFISEMKINKRKFLYIGAVVCLIIVSLFSMGGIALARIRPLPDEHIKTPSLLQQFIDINNDGYVDNNNDGIPDAPDNMPKNITCWHFIVDQWSKSSNPVIHIIWNDGTEDIKTADADTNFTDYYYVDICNRPAGSYVTKDSWVEIADYPDWQGQFNLSDVFCDEPAYPTPELPPVALLGIGLLGLVAYIGWKKHEVVFAPARNR